MTFYVTRVGSMAHNPSFLGRFRFQNITLVFLAGLDFKTKVISVNGQEENIQIWDTAGQERFRSITQSYFRKVSGFFW